MSITHILATELIDGATGTEGEDNTFGQKDNHTIPQSKRHFMSISNLAIENKPEDRKS